MANTNDKTLIVVLDDFSERVHDYGNTTLYDFGYLDLVTFYDNYYDRYTGAFSGYGNYDDFSVDIPDLLGGFHETTPDADSTSALDLDFVSTAPFVDPLGFNAYADTYLRYTYSDQSDESLPAHGDWVVEAINQTLDTPSKTEILCIDLDPPYSSLSHFSKIFDQVNYTVDGTTYIGSNFDKIVSDFIFKNDERSNGGTSDVTYSIAEFRCQYLVQKFLHR